MNESKEELILKLDLNDYLKDFKALFAREKDIFLQGDSNLHFKRIDELCKLDFPALPELSNLDKALVHLSKQGILHLDEIFEFVKIFRYFQKLKKLNLGSHLNAWLEKIELSREILEFSLNFDEKGELEESLDQRLINLNLALKIKKENILGEFKKFCFNKALMPYLIDTQIHLINDVQALLVRGGFHHVIKANIVGRSQGGGFYILPLSIENLQNDIEKIKNQKEEIYYEYAKNFSAFLTKNLLFLKFINNAFDLFDHYSARVLLAKKRDLEFVLCDQSRDLVLRDFAHPALKNPKSVSVEFKKQVLIITGVNAGGKSMLLKSILSAAFLAKHLLPMCINANKSKIGTFKEIQAIIEDPQNVKNDISTFAGRMLHFSKFFSKKDLFLGIDEIELGTDFEEAACLYSVLILKLLDKGLKIVITTHHKRLAMLLAKNKEVELIAALYDEENSRPKYEFLEGIIGKSYAFETALRYQIPYNLVQEAKKLYGEDKENLEDLVGKNINLELELKAKLQSVEKKEQKVDELLFALKEQKEKNEQEFRINLSKLELEFHKAIQEARKTIQLIDTKEKQRSLNKANELKRSIVLPSMQHNEELRIGDFVKYEKIKGQIIAISKNDATLESDGLKLRVPLKLLKKSSAAIKLESKTSISIIKPNNLSVSLDLHGLRSDEAILRLDKFLSDALIAGFDEVLVYHGMGTGKLAFAVREFLKAHKSVKSFADAPINQGGFGAKIVKL
ncbi:endonuclease MutS2 [Campylobacter sp. VicNov18]|uniref:endonuclease MutS2 n=1 Tax=Campylobacter bilis TaxID=2691918 RepID=UPI00130DC338|nr:endonuclease MutS2 [Campylobacter bilis]MPV63699.1 endonuclease MutS2 [Campylobacter hepaticus]MBM0637200.1 endonuclease MutS2 [Campylobacter bilis]MCC8277917.1 endonuclease MutS2 [Campylobacter bilis]MCC8298848.1 endonuclease MutS2 [Campylobacter bilis]MCC8300827.1 endonuclease MutS2 [Campylobacter bilis]